MMKTLGYILITIAFLAGSLVSVYEKIELEPAQQIEPQINWLYYSICMSIGIAGILLVRISSRRQNRSHEFHNENMMMLQASLQSISENLKKLNIEARELSPYEVHNRIDQLFPADLSAFVEARHCIAHTCSLAAYAEVMDNFAAGERYLNRVWSASTDGYIDEVNTYLEIAEKQFDSALQCVMKYSKIG